MTGNFIAYIIIILAAGGLGVAKAAPSFPAYADGPAHLRLSLAEAKRLWAKRNRELQLARSAVEGAQADRISAAQRPNPQFSVNSTSISPATGIGSGPIDEKQADTVFRIDQLVERGGKRELRTRAAEERLKAAQDDFADTQRLQELALDQAYYDLLLAQERKRIIDESADLFRQTLEVAELRLRAGDLAASEVARIRVDALRAENDRSSAIGDLHKAQAALAYLIGLENQSQRLEATDPWPQVILPPATASAAIDERPDVRAASARVRAAAEALDLARSLKTRDVSIGVQFEHNPQVFGANSVGFGISIPLLTNYQYEGEIRRAEADLEAARQALERARAQASTEKAQAFSGLQAAVKRVQRIDATLLPAARQAASAAEFAFRNGAIGAMDILDARRTLKAIELDAAAAHADYAKALAAWRAATTAQDRQP